MEMNPLPSAAVLVEVDLTLRASRSLLGGQCHWASHLCSSQKEPLLDGRRRIHPPSFEEPPQHVPHKDKLTL